jgi:pyruvate formate lyase activating enzyme
MKSFNEQHRVKMGEITGTVFKIKRFSIHDGPGIRTSVFLKGCPLNCVWCHSPEGIGNDISIWYNKNVCIACGRCIEVCPQGALRLEGEPEKYISIDRELCKTSGECVAVCPTNAIQFTGWTTTPSEIVSEVEKDIAFYDSSGGGITLTGGEPLWQPDFALEILSVCRERKIHTAIETSLFCSGEVLRRIAEKVDLFIADIKIIDPFLHRQNTGESNEIIRMNLIYLVQSGKRVIVRVPLIENITDTEENKKGIRNFVNGLNENIPVEFIDYNPLAANNYRRLGIPFPLENIKRNSF